MATATLTSTAAASGVESTSSPSSLVLKSPPRLQMPPSSPKRVTLLADIAILRYLKRVSILWC